jgi:antitoxin VapB
MNGRSQAVRLPAEFRFEGTEVHIRRDPTTGDVILSKGAKKADWDAFFRRHPPGGVPDDFMGPDDRDKSFGSDRGVFDDWEEG